MSDLVPEAPSDADISIPAYLTVDPVTGAIGANFTGIIHAQGLNLDEGVVDTPPDTDRIRWLDAANVAREYIYASAFPNSPGTARHLVLGTPNTVITLGDGVGIDKVDSFVVNLGGNVSIIFEWDVLHGTRIGFYGANPTAQYTPSGITAGFTPGTGTAARVDSEYTGGIGTSAYTIGDIVAALKNLGLIAM